MQWRKINENQEKPSKWKEAIQIKNSGWWQQWKNRDKMMIHFIQYLNISQGAGGLLGTEWQQWIREASLWPPEVCCLVGSIEKEINILLEWIAGSGPGWRGQSELLWTVTLIFRSKMWQEKDQAFKKWKEIYCKLNEHSLSSWGERILETFKKLEIKAYKPEEWVTRRLAGDILERQWQLI